MAAKETDLRNPSWSWAERQDASKETAMNADARMTSHAIEQHVVNELDAQASFDSAITYDKGQGFLRMLEAYLVPTRSGPGSGSTFRRVRSRTRPAPICGRR